MYAMTGVALCCLPMQQECIEPDTALHDCILYLTYDL